MNNFINKFISKILPIVLVFASLFLMASYVGAVPLGVFQGGTSQSGFGYGTVFATSASGNGNGALISTTTPTLTALIATSTTVASNISYRLYVGSSTPSTDPAFILNVGGIAQIGANSATSSVTGNLRILDNLRIQGALEITGGCKGCPGGASMEIGGAVTSGTTGSVLFINAGPVLAQDNSNFFFDDANNRLGIGTTTPWGSLSVEHPVSNVYDYPAFVVSDIGTTTPSFLVLNANGFVGIATKTPGTAFSVNGDVNIAGPLRLSGIVTGTSVGTSTLAGGLSAAIHLRAASIESTGDVRGVAGTFSGTVTGANASSTGSISAANLVNINGTGTSTATGGLSVNRLAATAASSTVSIATSTPSNISALEVKGDIFYKGQSYGEWVPLNMTAMNTIADCAEGNRFKGTLSIAITVVRAKNCRSGQVLLFELRQDSTGGRVIGWSTSSPIILNGQYASSTSNAVQFFPAIVSGNFIHILSATATVNACGLGC